MAKADCSIETMGAAHEHAAAEPAMGRHAGRSAVSVRGAAVRS